MLNKWDHRFLRIATEVASWSKDPHTKVGAVVVRDRKILSTGYNGIPHGVADLTERLERPLKYQFIEHAERNALCNINATNSTLYCTLLPCERCAPGIIQAGVQRLVLEPDAVEREWNEISREMLKEAGVQIDDKDIVW